MVIQPLDTGDNKTVRRIKRLNQSHTARKKAGQTIIEGYRLIEDALGAGVRPELVVYSPRWVEHADGRSFLVRLQALSIHLFYVTDRLFQELSQVETPQGILAVAPIPELLSVETLWRRAPEPILLPVAAGLQDPGNLGTLMRAALASGAHALGVTAGTVEPFNPKCIRASAGAAFRLPMVFLDAEGLQELRDRGAVLRATAVDAGKPYFDADWTTPSVMLLGNEGNGLDQDWRDGAELVTIPMSPAAESLNVSMAASVILFHAAFQREKAGIGFLPPAMV
jgi:TrmH family RNA methyltransferase